MSISLSARGHPSRKSAKGAKVNVSRRFSRTERFVLFALAGADLYGLEIAKSIESASGGTIKVHVGSLYPAIHKLEKDGFIMSQERDVDSRKEARRLYYGVTSKGKDAISEIKEFWKRLENGSSENSRKEG